MIVIAPVLHVVLDVYIPYSRKVWQGETLAYLLFLSIWWKKVWQMNSSANRLSIVTITNLVDFSLANYRRFTKFTKLSPHQTFSLYGMYCLPLE